MNRFKIFFILVFFIFNYSKALECYHCYSNDGKENSLKNQNYEECNYKNLTASNTWVCPHVEAKCSYQKVQTSGRQQIWRTCSNGVTDPCDPNFLPPNTKLLECKTCTTDKCNLMVEEKNATFTFNVNANINLYIKQ